jgi:hypothetical protein
MPRPCAHCPKRWLLLSFLLLAVLLLARVTITLVKRAESRVRAQGRVSDDEVATVPPQLRVHLWNDTNPNKLKELLFNQEGWSLHPRTRLVDRWEDADLVVWITTMVRVEMEVVPLNIPNVVVLDYSDGCTLHPRRRELRHELVYFKRSWVLRQDGVQKSICTKEPKVYPIM